MKRTIGAAVTALALLGAATASRADIINIDSTTAEGVTVALVAGADYTLSYAVAGTAGASYLAWNPGAR